MIHSVSFGNFEAEIAKAPMYSTQTQAASGMRRRRSTGGKSTTSKVLTTVGVVAAAAIALALLRGKVKSISEIDLKKTLKDQEGFTAKFKYCVAKAGQSIIDGFNWVKAKIPFLGKKEQAAEGAANAAEDAVNKNAEQAAEGAAK